jgi:hypothetical protein
MMIVNARRVAARAMTGICLAVVVAGSGLAVAQEAYPTRPVEFVVPWGPGGGADQVARKSGVMLEQLLKVSFPVINVAGASGQTGLAKMLAAAPDGYTISIMTGDTFGIQAAGKPGPLAHTFSIVARDPVTGDLGVAVQSHWFSVGSIVTWAEAGVGAIATQSFVEPAYGYKGLELMRGGMSAPDALRTLLAADAQREVRQVAFVDAQGRVDAFTGTLDIAFAGHHVGAQFSAQANMMENARVWPAMAAGRNAMNSLTRRC